MHGLVLIRYHILAGFVIMMDDLYWNEKSRRAYEHDEDLEVLL